MIINVAVNEMLVKVGNYQKLDIPGPYGDTQGIHPSVLRIRNKFAGYENWMAYTPYDNFTAAKETPCIVASNDGVNWVVPAGLTNPLEGPPCAGWYCDPVLIFDGTKLWVYWQLIGVTPSYTYRSGTEDGVHWSAKETITGVGGGLTGGGMAIIDGRYFGYVPSSTTPYAIPRYSSADGLAFSEDEPATHNLGCYQIRHMQIYRDGSGFHFMANACGTQPEGPPKDNGYKLYYGYSVDGKIINFDLNPVLIPDGSDWTNKSMYTAQLVPGDGQLHNLYFSATTNQPKTYIGLQKVKLNISPFIHNLMPPRIEYFLFENLEIRDTANYYGGGGTGVPVIPLYYYKNKVLFISSSLDQAITLNINQGDSYFTAGSGEVKCNAMPDGNAITIPANSRFFPRYVDKSVFPILGMMVNGVVKFKGKCTVAPTTGKITVRVIAWN